VIRSDPVIRNSVIGVVLIGVVILLSVSVAFIVREKPVDQRWAEWSQPTIVGELLEDNTRASRTTSNGAPIANPDGTVTLAFKRCGPVSMVAATSTRTWVIRTPTEEFLGFEGQTVAVDILTTEGGCNIFDLTYPIPPEVMRAAECCDSTIELRFTIEPIDPQLGRIDLETEPFLLYSPDLDGLSLETVTIE
jgi:hypothetical protein